MPYKIFISSANRDKDLAKDLGQRLEQIGVVVYSTQRNVEKQAQFIINNALREADELIVILTSNSVNNSALMFEIGAGFSLQKQVTPLIVGLTPEQLPPIIKEMEYINYDNLHVYLQKLKKRTNIPKPDESRLFKSAKRKSKKTARIVCANTNEFWTTQKQFWQWVREGLVDVTGQNPLTGRFAGRREKLMIMVRHITLDAQGTAGNQDLVGSYSRLVPHVSRHTREDH